MADHQSFGVRGNVEKRCEDGEKDALSEDFFGNKVD